MTNNYDDSDDEIFKERRLKVEDILNNKHNDIDLLICPDFPYERSSIQQKEMGILKYYEKFYYYLLDKKIHVLKEEFSQNGFGFYKNPETGEIIRMKGINYGNLTLKINYKKNIRPFHIYFNHSLADFKVKKDLLERIPFSVLVRRSNVMDLKYAAWNGEKNGIYENPLFVRE